MNKTIQRVINRPIWINDRGVLTSVKRFRILISSMIILLFSSVYLLVCWYVLTLYICLRMFLYLYVDICLFVGFYVEVFACISFYDIVLLIVLDIRFLYYSVVCMICLFVLVCMFFFLFFSLLVLETRFSRKRQSGIR